VQIWESFRVWRSWQTSVPVDVGILSWASGPEERKLRGRRRQFFSLYDFLRLRLSVGWTFGRLPKKTFFLPTIAFPGIGSSVKGEGIEKGWFGRDWEVCESFFFSYFGCD
jgi:hypothetical protein